MAQEHTTVAAKKADKRWVTSETLDDRAIEEFSKEILSTPTASTAAKQPLYSYDQMIQMFRSGYKMMSQTEGGQQILRENKLALLSSYSLLRELKVNEATVLPYEKWSAVRTAASRLKKEFGCVYCVKKVTPHGTPGNIKVIRIT